MDMAGAPLIILILAVIGLGYFVIRFGSAMNRLEQQVSDLTDRIDKMGRG